ncbi:MAG: hypothetical protein V3W51_02125 [Candidatus Brocadiales bacterium]
MKTCFVNPPKNRAEPHSNMRHVESSNTTVPPCGLLHLITVTRDLGYKTGLIDSIAMNSSHEEALQRIPALKPDVSGLTAVAVTVNNATKAARLAKEAGCR